MSVAVSALAAVPVPNSTTYITTTASGDGGVGGKGRGRGGIFSAAVSSSEGQCPDVIAPDSSGSVIVASASEKHLSRTVISNQDARKVGDVCIVMAGPYI